MINWQYFPKSDEAPDITISVVSVFEKALNNIDSSTHEHSSNVVLAEVCPGLQELGFDVETGKKQMKKLKFQFYSG